MAALTRSAEGPVRATMASARAGSGAGVRPRTRSAKANSPTSHISATTAISVMNFMMLN
ncbi:hypothetical protein D3C80_2015920 [compost metagenome]